MGAFVVRSTALAGALGLALMSVGAARALDVAAPTPEPTIRTGVEAMTLVVMNVMPAA